MSLIQTTRIHRKTQNIDTKGRPNTQV